MAAVRPEPEESLDNQCENSDLRRDEHKEGEREVTADGAPQSGEDRLQENANAQEAKEPAEARNDSPDQSGESDRGKARARRKLGDAPQDGEELALVWSGSEEELVGRGACSISGKRGTGEYEHEPGGLIITCQIVIRP